MTGQVGSGRPSRTAPHKHRAIASELARDIRGGILANGSRLPGEHALADRFAVSRTTVRHALGELHREGLIATHSGIGSFVTFDVQAIDGRPGWTRALAGQGVPTLTRTLRLELVDDPALAASLGVSGERFVAVERVRTLADGPAVSLERSRVLAAGDLADLPQRGLTGGSLTATLRAAGLHVDHGEEWAGVTALGDADAHELGRDAGLPFLETRRVTWTPDGRLVEHVSSLLDPLRFRLYLRFGESP